jgi:hypothetical protein
MNNILNHIERCAQKFNKYSLIVYENDSTDKTREILNSRKRENYYYIFENDVTEPSRTARIARGRNFILDKARELNATNDYDLLIMLDLDIVNAAGTFADTIDTCFEHENWDALTANQDTYYDLWALRNADLNYDCWKEIDAENKSCLDLNELKYKPGQLIEVDSAFGGTAVYKLSSIPLECRYVGKRENGEEICEHVPFNKCIKSGGGKIFINTSFINDGGSDLH